MRSGSAPITNGRRSRSISAAIAMPPLPRRGPEVVVKLSGRVQPLIADPRRTLFLGRTTRCTVTCNAGL
jgi:hypothetical protein